MCNRYRQLKTRENLSRIFDARPIIDDELPKSEFYPKYPAPVIRKEGEERLLDVMNWGIPLAMRGKNGQALKPKPVTNVRNLASPFWKSTMSRAEWRCLVPFTSFAEPRPGKDEEGRPACWWFDLPASEAAAFAGIWRPSEWGNCFAFLTCEPNPLVAPKHPKAMPVILHPEDYDHWLDGDYDNVCALAQPYPSQLMAVA